MPTAAVPSYCTPDPLRPPTVVGDFKRCLPRGVVYGGLGAAAFVSVVGAILASTVYFKQVTGAVVFVNYVLHLIAVLGYYPYLRNSGARYGGIWWYFMFCVVAPFIIGGWNALVYLIQALLTRPPKHVIDERVAAAGKDVSEEERDRLHSEPTPGQKVIRGVVLLVGLGLLSAYVFTGSMTKSIIFVRKNVRRSHACLVLMGKSTDPRAHLTSTDMSHVFAVPCPAK